MIVNTLLKHVEITKFKLQQSVIHHWIARENISVR